MTDRQNEKLNMHQTVLKYCREHAGAYAGIPAFIRGVDELEGYVAETKFIAGQQSGVAVKGTTAQKNNAENILVQACLTVAGPLYVYAYENKNAVLMEKVAVNKNSFYKVHGNQALALAVNIAGEAATHAVALADYGVTDADREALDAAIANYEALIVLPRTSINERKQHTGNLAQILAAADSALYDKLDKLVIRFKDTNPPFYNGYKNARNINNSYVRHRSAGNNNSESPTPGTE
jgi:hypothetical protein